MPTENKPTPEIVLRDPATLIAYAGNARLHPESQITALMRSIETFGFTIPALIDEAGEIIAGHGRIEAAKRLGLKHVPTLIATGWTAEQTRTYRLADNRLAEMAEWDDDILAAEFTALDALDLDMTLTGFDIGEISALIEEPDFRPDPDTPPPRLDEKAKITCPECGHAFQA